MKKQLLVLLVVFSLSAFLAGIPWTTARSATEPAGLAIVRVWINPEYDDPRVLTMIEGKITGADPPALVRFLVPSAAEMYSAGSIDAQGKYTGGPPDRKPSSVTGWDEISYTLTSSTFRVEYYDPSIVGLPNKSISYDFTALYPISDLAVMVQEPKRSSNFLVQPKEQSIAIDAEGFQVHRYVFSNLAADAITHFDISYTKPDAIPGLQPSTGATEGNGPSWLLFAGLAAVVAAVLVFVGVAAGSRRTPARARMSGKASAVRRKYRPESSPVNKAPSRSAPSIQKPGPGVDISQGTVPNKFCTECGNRIEGQAKFCPNCGAKR